MGSRLLLFMARMPRSLKELLPSTQTTSNPLVIALSIIIGLLLLVLLAVYPWVGLTGTLLAAPLKTLPGGSGPFNVAKGFAIATVLAWLGATAVRRMGIRLSGMEVGVLWLLAVYTLTALSSDRPYIEIAGAVSLISLWGMILLITNLCRTRAHLKYVVLALAASALAPVAVALVQSIMHYDPIAGRRLSMFYPWVRAHGTYTLCTQFSAEMVPLVLLGSAMLMFRCTRSAWLCFLVPVQLLGVVLALGRASLIGVLLGGGYLVFFAAGRVKGMTWLVRGWQKALGVAVLGIACALIFQWAAVRKRTTYTAAVESGSGRRRVSEYSLALEMFSQSPIFGVGFHGYSKRVEQLSAAEGSAPGESYARVPHNILLRFLACGGVIGFGGALCFIWLVIRKVWTPYPLVHGRTEHIVLLGCRAALVGLLPDMLTHGGLFANNLWSILGVIAAARCIADRPASEADDSAEKVLVPAKATEIDGD